MSNEQFKNTKLSDVLNYEMDTYLSLDEVVFIQNTFKDKRAINILRKVFLPSVGDPELPIEEVGNDVWLQGTDYKQIPEAEIKSIVLARQEAIKFIVGSLIKLKMIANQGSENDKQKALREKRNSSQ